MLGLDRLVQLRRDGMRPDLVTLFAPSVAGRYACEGSLYCERDDKPSKTDLRALKGLTVVVFGETLGGFDEAEAWMRAVIAAEAKNVALGLFSLIDRSAIEPPVWMHKNGETLA